MPLGVAADSTSSDTAPSFQEAFAAAREEHSKPAPAGDEHAAADEDSTATAKTGKDTPPPSTTEAPETAAESAQTETNGLLSDAEFTALHTKHASDPAKLVKELNRAFTQKTQALAAERKSYERMKPYTGLIDRFEEAPAETLAALAEQYGLTVSPKGSAPAGETTPATEAASAVTDAFLDKFRDQLGPELEYLADGLAPAIKGLVEELTRTSVDEATKPLKAAHETLLGKAAEEATDTVMETFGTKYPDWKDHEPAMLELSQKVQPNGMDEVEYLEHLYKVVTRDAWDKNRDTHVADEVKKALAKIQKGADTQESQPASMPEGKVVNRPSGVPSFGEAFAAARAGVRWD